MKYDSKGMRTQKDDKYYTTSYYYDSNNNLIGIKVHGTVLCFYYDSDGNATSFSHNGTKYYYVKNLQGDVMKIINHLGNVVVTYTYDAWGKILNQTDSTVYNLTNINPFRYRGYVYDNETGLYYLQSRYYDPITGRFLNADDTAYIGATGTVLSSNLFAYCENNTVNKIDNNGNIAHNIVGAIVGGLLNIGSYMISVWMKLEKFSWWSLLFTASCGLLTGALAASSFRRATQIVINISISVASNLSNYLRNNKKPKIENIIIEIVIGCIVGLVSGFVGGHGSGKLFKKASNNYVKKWISYNRKAIINGTKYYIKSFKKLLLSKVIKPIFKSFIYGLVTDKTARKVLKKLIG